MQTSTHDISSQQTSDGRAASGSMTREAMEAATPGQIRAHIRARRWQGHTKRLAIGYHQANLIIVRQEHAFDFLRFCLRNNQALPLLDVTDPGDPVPRRVAPDGDVRTDAGEYAVYRDGTLAERVEDLRHLWRADHVAFLTGCSISLDRPVREAGLRFVKASEDDPPSPMYVTRRACVPAGIFSGPLVVGMRVIPDEQVAPITAVTSRYGNCHGAPVHIGNPGALISDIAAPDWGTARTIPSGHTPVFWACGLTAQVAARVSGIPEMITQTVGRMFVTDLPVTPSV